MNNKIKGHSAILIANTIFGLGIPVTKYLLDSWVTPMTYMASRCIGAAAIFWLISFFMPKEHIRRKDLVIIILGGLTGVVMLTRNREKPFPRFFFRLMGMNKVKL